MNKNERKYFSNDEKQFTGIVDVPLKVLLKSIMIKIRRKTWGKLIDRDTRMSWNVAEVSDVTGPADNVRNYLERSTIRNILKEISKEQRIVNASEVGCGYGRVIMVLKEFAENVVGFEREDHLVRIASELLPDIKFYQCEVLEKIGQITKTKFDFMMTCTVLQHLTDEVCRKVLNVMKEMTPKGHILLIEKTEPNKTTKEYSEGNKFLSRSRSVEDYSKMMEPFILVMTKDRVLENTYDNKTPGKCMLFQANI